ncbi:MAG: HD domain-containing protein [Salibacteraceae bacterium]
MSSSSPSKRKIFNDPVYGFISIPNDLIFDLIEHRYFQRLRRISQLGLTNAVYSGAIHTRFQHALGAMHLMTEAIEVIRSKGIEITEAEANGVLVAILMHDIGHGPFSHTLERSLVEGVSHEDISAIIMDRLNQEFNGQLDLAIPIFRNQYPKKFLHQLVSSQLDMDRLDYLKRDSFFSGVSEGVIGLDRIIKMLNVVNDGLVVEAKGIYSIEKFLISRRIMYWQVYLHKTVLGAEYLLMHILKRAKELADRGVELFATPSFRTLLYHHYSREDFLASPEAFESFLSIDDFDILTSVKVWVNHPDPVLANMCRKLAQRDLLKVEMQNHPFDPTYLERVFSKALNKYGFSPEETAYFVFNDSITNSAYQPHLNKINILFKDGTVKDFAKAFDNEYIAGWSEVVKKHFFCYPKGL